MSVSVAAPVRAVPRTASALPGVYTAGLVFWLVTRLLVLMHQGAWPWMNAFVVDAARGIVVGDWNDAVRPQLPAFLGVPLVLAGASEQQTVAALYVVASLIQFAAFVVLVRAVFPGRVQEQTLALLVFLLVPYDHSIHHYRDMPVVLASAAVLLLSAHFVRGVARQDGEARGARERALDVAGVAGVLLLGLWSRGEVLTFVGALVLLALVVYRRRAVRLALTYAVLAVVIPTENCREADGLAYFGPADLHAGVLALAMNHPLTTAAKTVRSAWDNLWTLLGPNTSTFPGIIPFVALALTVVRPARERYTRLPLAAWITAAAVLAESVLPPLSWAPPHPQYHLQLVLPIVVLVVPILVALARMPRGRLVAIGFLVANAGLSALRYTRYPGY
jgi:hypothetical protein